MILIKIKSNSRAQHMLIGMKISLVSFLFVPLQLVSGDKDEEGTRYDKLNKVRQLFWQTYRLFSEETSPSSTRSITGLLSKLATSVGMGGSSNT